MSLGTAIAAFLLATSLCGAADEAPDAVAIQAMIGRLDDETFIVRQQATADLIKAGNAAVALLEKAIEAGTIEQRSRATEALRMIRKRRFGAAFEELGKRAEKDIDVESGMVLIAQILDPEVTGKSIAKKLDEVAAAVRKAAGKGVEVKSLSGADAVELITDVLKNDYGLAGDKETYDHPDNSSIHRTFEQKNGLPILLSEIAVAVGKRLEVPLVGIAVPRNYMFKYDGSKTPGGGTVADDVIVDAHDDWQVKDRDLIAQRWRFDEENLKPSKPRATIERMMRNLELDYLETGDSRRAADVRDWLLKFVGPEVDEGI